MHFSHLHRSARLVRVVLVVLEVHLVVNGVPNKEELWGASVTAYTMGY